MPADYHPLLLCDLRVAPEGGGVRAPATARATLDQLARRRCAFMVHGFNNHAGEAAHAYNGFRVQQLARVPGLSELALDRRLADVHWPGDADWWGPTDQLDFLVYPLAVAHARESAEQLAALIQHELPALEVVDFVGHSLGCRVILETLQRLHDAAVPVHVGRVVLMAAAVPADFLEPGGRFHELLWTLLGDGTVIEVLHSNADTVLRYAFPAGQALAGEPSLHALGLGGPSPLVPGYHATVHDEQIAGAGHGDYWGHAGTAAAHRASALAGEALGLAE
jgi:hypothetical protein